MPVFVHDGDGVGTGAPVITHISAESMKAADEYVAGAMPEASISATIHVFVESVVFISSPVTVYVTPAEYPPSPRRLAEGTG